MIASCTNGAACTSPANRSRTTQVIRQSGRSRAKVCITCKACTMSPNEDGLMTRRLCIALKV